jgi:hypothetical protein
MAQKKGVQNKAGINLKNTALQPAGNVPNTFVPLDQQEEKSIEPVRARR